MLHSVKDMEGYALRARDGDIGKVRDFYFDDQHWHVRYFVVDTGAWLTGRRVLISPEAVSGQIWADKVIPVKLTQDQVRSSPSIDTAKPVSRQHEMKLRHHYGWPPYWSVVFPEAATAPIRDDPPLDAPAQRYTRTENLGQPTPASATRGDPHLRSTSEVSRYHIEALDGSIGHLDDFLIDDYSWRIRYLVVDTRNWWPGKKVIIAPGWIRDVSWAESKVVAALSRATIRNSPAYDPTQPVTAEYADRLHDHYSRPRYPDWDPDHKTAESRRNFRE